MNKPLPFEFRAPITPQELIRLVAVKGELLATLEHFLTAFPDPTFQVGDRNRLRANQVEVLNGTILDARAAITKARNL